MFECLNDIVGILDADCECFTGELAPDLKAELLKPSKSGLYTDNLEGGVHFKMLKQTDPCNEAGRIMLDARNEAIKRTTDDLIVMLNQRYAKNKNVFIGHIGQLQYSKPLLSINNRMVGMRLRSKELSDGILTIKKISMSCSSDAPIDIHIYKAKFGSNYPTHHKTFTVNGIGGSGGTVTLTLPTPEKLPLQEERQALEYYIVYDKTMINFSFDNKVSCSCGSIEKALKSFLDTDGVQVQNITDVTNRTINGYSHGISLEVDLRCDNQTFVCREYDENDAVAVVMAYAVLYKAGELIIEGMLKSPEINRFTMMNREYLWGKRNHFRKEYESRIAYLGSEGIINLNSTNCFICKQNDLFFGGILA